jgi:excisionase family DNA binding protein
MTIACEIPIWHKSNLTLEESASYFNIGINKLRQMTDSKACEKYVLWVGRKRLIKREPFEAYLSTLYSV